MNDVLARAQAVNARARTLCEGAEGEWGLSARVSAQAVALFPVTGVDHIAEQCMAGVNQFGSFGNPQHLARFNLVQVAVSLKLETPLYDEDDFVIEQGPAHFGAFPTSEADA